MARALGPADGRSHFTFRFSPFLGFLSRARPLAPETSRSLGMEGHGKGEFDKAAYKKWPNLLQCVGKSKEEAVWPLPLAQAPWGPAGGCLVTSTGVPLPPRGDSAGHLGLAPFLPRWEVGPLESRVSHVGFVARGLAKQGQQRAFRVSLAPGRNASGLCQPARPVDLAPGRAGLLCRLERAGLADPHCP